jgi:hypothetical protein
MGPQLQVEERGAEAGYGPNDEVERRGSALPTNEVAFSQTSTPSMAYRSCRPAIARTDC